MTAPRTFTAGDTDERVPLLLAIVMLGISAARDAGLVPERIILDTRTYQAIAAFIRCDTVDELFGLPVYCNLNSDAESITVESGSRPHG